MHNLLKDVVRLVNFLDLSCSMITDGIMDHDAFSRVDSSTGAFDSCKFKII